MTGIRTGGVLAVHAHPDDESITMGATLARYAAQGIPVTLVTATLGEQGEIMHAGSLGLDRLDAEHADQLGGFRLTEWWAACRALGITDARLLGGLGRFRDSGMAGTASARHPRAFCRAGDGGPDHDEAVVALGAVLDEVRPRVVLTYDSDGGYGHPDHVAAHQVTVAAVRAWRASRGDAGDGRDGDRGGDGVVEGAVVEGGVVGGAGSVGGGGAEAGDEAGCRLLAVVRPRSVLATALDALWRGPLPAGYRRPELAGLGGTVPDADVHVTVPVGPWRAARRAAMAAHATQLDVWAGVVDGFALTNRYAQPLTDAEYFRLLAGPPPPPGATDLFAGLSTGGP